MMIIIINLILYLLGPFSLPRSEAESSSVIQDVSNGWLCVRFACADSALVGYQGSLGVLRVANLKQVHALKLREATTNIVNQFFCPTGNMPHSEKKRILSRMIILGYHYVFCFAFGGTQVSSGMVLRF